MDIQKNEKVLAMYRAVWELIDEGYDVSSMKVADITGRAGIGKGTAYEYFRSKDEIVSEALKYDYYVQFKSLSERLEAQVSFRDALETCFVWLSENVDRRRFASQFFKEPSIHEKESESNHKMEKTCEEGDESYKNVVCLMKLIVSLGRNDGSIRDDVTEEMAMIQIVSQLFGYFLYHNQYTERKKQELDEMKQFLCDNIEKSLK